MKRAATVLAMVGLVAACGVSDGPGPSTTTGPTTTSTAEGGADGNAVSTRETTLGTVLVDPSGFTMYVFTEDSNGESVCYESCAALWPPVPGDVAIGPGLNSSMFGTTTRTDGSTQLTVNGRPLYLWVSDTQPGDVTGQSVEDVWFVVGPDGQMIGAPTGQPEEPDDSDGHIDNPYDY